MVSILLSAIRVTLDIGMDTQIMRDQWYVTRPAIGHQVINLALVRLHEYNVRRQFIVLIIYRLDFQVKLCQEFAAVFSFPFLVACI